MRNAIWELKSIGAYSSPDIQKKIEDWIEKHVGEVSVDLHCYYPERPETQQYALENAKAKLGKAIAENSNTYPKFEQRGLEWLCKLSALYFKNEFGK